MDLELDQYFYDMLLWLYNFSIPKQIRINLYYHKLVNNLTTCKVHILFNIKKCMVFFPYSKINLQVTKIII